MLLKLCLAISVEDYFIKAFIIEINEKEASKKQYNDNDEELFELLSVRYDVRIEGIQSQTIKITSKD